MGCGNRLERTASAEEEEEGVCRQVAVKMGAGGGLSSQAQTRVPARAAKRGEL